MKPRTPPPDRQEGSSLVEVLVAFAILALVVIMAMRGFAQGIGQVGKAEQVSAMLDAGQSLLAQVSIEPQVLTGRSHGTTQDGHFWSLDISPKPDGPAPAWTNLRAFTLELRIAGNEALEQPLVMSTIVIAKPAR